MTQERCTYPNCDYPCMNLPDCKEQEPVAWRYGALLYHDKLDAMEFIRTSGDSYLLEPLYTHPPQRTWVGLTDEEVVQCQQGNIYHFYRCIEAKLKEKNT